MTALSVNPVLQQRQKQQPQQQQEQQQQQIEQQQNEQQQQQQQQQQRRTVSIRGGFSTSICDLFSDPSRKSDCCAITCCGLFVSDRTRYLALGTLPPPWWKRILINLVLPTALCAAILVSKEGLLLLLLLLLILLLLLRAQHHRKLVRLAVMEQMRAARPQNHPSPLSIDDHRTVRQAHRSLSLVANDCAPAHPAANDDGRRHDDGRSVLPEDFCTLVWKGARCLCCGWGGCWCQCCGVCGVGQEDREMQRVLPKGSFQLDYVTFEGYGEYFPRILAVREKRVASFREHVGALSKLSYMLVRSLGVCFLILVGVAVSHLITNIIPETILVVLATFFQAFFVLYFVYWRWNRFDLSFDAVVKYFSSGFVLCSSLALAYEMFIQIILSGTVYVTTLIAIVLFNLGGGTFTSIADMEETEGKHHFVVHHEKLFEFSSGVSAFAQAFLTAALVEELAKFFCFWMVEHPDFLKAADIMVDGAAVSAVEGGGTSADGAVSSAALDNYGSIVRDGEVRGAESTEVDADFAENGDRDKSSRTLRSRGAATTVAMVATALGFACFENLVYVFVYTPPGISNEVSVLIYRSLFPLHPIAAAIQSIGVIRRDLEGDTSYGLGRILFPAFLYHGSFDFTLMLLNNLQSLHSFEETADDDTVQQQNEDTVQQDTGNDDMLSLLLSSTILVLGIVYYVAQARAQRKRLTDLDLSAQKRTSQRRRYDTIAP